MQELDLIISFALMVLLFLRQAAILRRQNKINYAPMILGIGVISAIIHLILYIQPDNSLSVLKEALSPVIVSLFLFVVMNVLHQVQKHQDEQMQQEFSSSLSLKIAQMKEYIAMLEDKIEQMHDDEQQSLFDMRQQIKKEISSLKVIQTNQEKYIGQFETLVNQQSKVTKEFEKFTSVQLPELDQVMHSHIDMLRISEQDHYNRIKKASDSADVIRCDIKDEITEVRDDIKAMKHLSKDIANAIVKNTLSELSKITHEFEKQLNNLRAQSESVSTSLSEGETILDAIRKQSEMVMKQIVLSSNNMRSIEEYSRNLSSVYNPLKELISEIESIRFEYKAAHQELTNLAALLSTNEKEQIEVMKNRVDELSSKLIENIDASLEKLHTHYHIASNEVTNTVSELAKKTKLQSGYE